MPLADLVQIALYLGLVVAVAKPVGTYLFKVFSGERTFLHPVLGRVEKSIYRFAKVDPDSEMSWSAYTISLLVFSAIGVVVLFALLRLQGILPLNPEHVPGMPTHIAFNTAVSFVTNTNWQAYSGEASASYLSQMVGLDLAELRLRRRRHRGGGRVRPRAHSRTSAGASATSGSI